MVTYEATTNAETTKNRPKPIRNAQKPDDFAYEDNRLFNPKEI